MDFYTLGELRELVGDRTTCETDAYSELLRRQRLVDECVSNCAKDPEDPEEKKD
tara:strand:- start:63 stop:224 length:162 start_codon:yes stop_codon:yes gene_type:complete